MYRTKPVIRPRAGFWIGLVFAIVSLGFAAFSGYWVMYRLGYALVGVLLVSYVWTRVSLRGLQAEVDRHTDRVQEGEDIVERITVRNESAIPKLWIEIQDPTEVPSHHARFVVSLPSKGRRSRRVATRCERRGVYSIGPLQIASGDPFGLYSASMSIGPAESILVYPRPIELTNFEVPAANLPGDGRFRRRTHYVTPNSAGIREYAIGDSFNRIHWPSTARLGQLMVKLFELDPASDIWIALDLQETAQAGEGMDGTEEVGVRIAASIARALLVGNRSVGLLAYGARLHTIEADRGQQQLTHILEALAMAQATGDVSLGDLLFQEGRRFGRHTTVVAVTASLDEQWVTALQGLAQRGVRTAAIYMEPETFGAGESSLLVFGALMAADLPAHFVRRGDDLRAALSPGGQDASRQELISGQKDRQA
ncbi:MAG TPA: DUF58 domain-containing protein [Dehalococcoidia bacterium]|nr:DUF58 domain-containing protein [Dehalococcoidia bacterium]